MRRGLTWLGDGLVELSCGYGESLGRVFATLLVTFVAFMGVYAATGAVTRTTGAAPEISRRLSDLAVFSMQAMSNTQGSAEGLKPTDVMSVFLTGMETLVSIFLTGLLGFVAGNRIRR